MSAWTNAGVLISEFILEASGPLSAFWEWNDIPAFCLFGQSFICVTILKGINLNPQIFRVLFLVLEDTSGSLTFNSCCERKGKVKNNFFFFFYSSGGITEKGRVVASGHFAAVGNGITAPSCVALFLWLDET